MTETSTNDLASVQKAYREGKRLKFLFFWGHRPSPDGKLSASCFSQWWPARFVVDGVPYASAEHYMMAEKARLFGDEEIRTKILSSPSPGAAKALGRRVRNFDGETWSAHRFEFVVTGNVAKFGQDRALRDYLLATKNRILVEASPRDRIWGIGLAASNERAKNPLEWQGLNLLGFALMAARNQLR